MADWHKADIKAALEKKGYRLSDIGRELGFDPESANQVLFRKWGTMEQAIAKILGVRAEEIWPSRYQEPKKTVRSAVPRRSGRDRRTRPDRRKAA